MSINPNMAFLNKLADGFKELEIDYLYLAVSKQNIPALNDRFPYTSEDDVEDYDFHFSFNGKDFEVQPKDDDEFRLEVTEYKKRPYYQKVDNPIRGVIKFTKKEHKETIKKKIAALLEELHSKIPKDKPQRVFFDMWCRWTGFPDDLSDTLHELLTEYIESNELEEMLAKRYKDTKVNYDGSINDKVFYSAHTSYHEFFEGLYHLVTSKDTIYITDDKQEALEILKTETLKNIESKIDEEINRYIR